MEQKDSNQFEIEQQESVFIQHLRTAGLRKTREKALLDEFTSIRRTRRQLITYLTTKIHEVLIFYSCYELVIFIVLFGSGGSE